MHVVQPSAFGCVLAHVLVRLDSSPFLRRHRISASQVGLADQWLEGVLKWKGVPFGLEILINGHPRQEYSHVGLTGKQYNFDSRYPMATQEGRTVQADNTVGKNGEPNALGLYDMHGKCGVVFRLVRQGLLWDKCGKERPSRRAVARSG